MNEIRSYILEQLQFNDDRRFSELNPGGVESSHLTYHLKQLSDDGLIERSGTRYRLSALGIKQGRQLYPPVTITILLALQDQKGRWLLQNKIYYPFIGTIGWPSGFTKIEETTLTSATRVLFEKTGWQAELTFRGSVYVTLLQGNTLLYKTLSHIFHTKTDRQDAHCSTGEPDPQWEYVSKPDSGHYRPGFKELWPLISSTPSNKHVWEEVVVDLT